MFHVKHIQKCPLCSAQEFSDKLSCKDNLVSKKAFNISSCNNCGFWFTNPIPEESTIGDYYKSEDYVSHSKTKKGVINTLYHWVKVFSIKQKFVLVSRYFSSSKTLLDYGCGTGDFLVYAKKNGVDVKGYEPDEQARKLLSDKHQVLVENTSKIHEENKGYDVITLWHVLEHIYDLNKDFSKLTSLLNNDGRVIVAVPNRNSFDAKYYEENWAAYDVPRHLYHFTKKDMQRLAKNHGLIIELKKPMLFDAFYVSMLSEKNKGGFVLWGVLIGLLSNLSAFLKYKNHSSLIYVLKKRGALLRSEQ